MLARRIKQIGRYWLTILVVVLSFFLAAVWVESYRTHPKGVLSPEELEYNLLNPDAPQWTQYPPHLTGRSYSFDFGRVAFIDMKFASGRMFFSVGWPVSDDEPRSRDWYRWRSFAFEQWIHPSYRSGPNGTLAREGIYRIYLVTLPLWLLIALCYVYPFVKFVRGPLRSRRRRERGHCIHCGYDLRGSDGFCPECGEMAQSVRDSPIRD